jgi:hypothetical protein
MLSPELLTSPYHHNQYHASHFYQRGNQKIPDIHTGMNHGQYFEYSRQQLSLSNLLT